jgi:hypothetical protein
LHTVHPIAQIYFQTCIFIVDLHSVYNLHPLFFIVAFMTSKFITDPEKNEERTIGSGQRIRVMKDDYIGLWVPMVRSSFFSGSVMNFDVIKATIKNSGCKL